VSGVATALVLGVTLNSRSEDDYIIERCSFPEQCMPVARSRDGGESFTEPGAFVGADIRVPVGPWFEIGPSFLVSGFLRQTCKTNGRSCTSRPAPPGSVRVDVGVKLVWYLQ
jgi:hypothetical protein